MNTSLAFMNSDWISKNKITNPVFIGGGNFSKVYSFIDPEDNTEKALKVIKKIETDDLNDWINEANEELLVVKCLKKCPHILNLERYYIDIKKEYIFLITPKAQMSLAKLIKERKQLDSPLLTKFMRTLLEGLSFAHNLEIVHRDLKPDNILVTASEDFLIADWGIARMMKAKGTQLQRFTTAGTESYLPPECYYDAKGTTINLFKADVYSLALVFMSACGVSEQEIDKGINKLKKEKHDRDILDLLEERVSGQSQALVDLLKIMCAFDPNERCDIFKAQELFSRMLQKVSSK